MTLPTSQTTTAGRLTAILRGSALPGFEARVGLVDDVDPAPAAHELAVAVTRLERLERASDLHHLILRLGRRPGFDKSGRLYGPPTRKTTGPARLIEAPAGPSPDS